MSRDFARLTDLFQEGQVLELARGDQTVTVWINKLSPFELEEARQDGRIARARHILAIKEIGSPEYEIFQASIADVSDEAVINALLESKQSAWIAQAVRDIRSDPDWTERVEVVEQSGDLVGRDPDDPEIKLLAKLSLEYTEEIQRRVAEERKAERDTLIVLNRDDLEEQYRDNYVDQQGLTAFTVEYQRTEVFYALRACHATKNAEGEWDHTDCNHNEKVCDSRDDVARLPEAVWMQVRNAIMQLNMPQDVARFSDAPASSSASSERPSEAVAESTPSIPEEIPVEPVGTS